jgi:hypothetical protein
MKGRIFKVMMLSVVFGLIFLWGLALHAGEKRPEFTLQFSETEPQLVVTAEYMSYEDLLDPRVMDLARRHNLLVAPCIWSEHIDEGLDRLYTEYKKAGIQIIFWPQIPRDKGLYLNKKHADDYLEFLDTIYAWADEHGHRIEAMIIDIEPPSYQTGTTRGPDEPEPEQGLGLGPILKLMGKKSFEESKAKFEAVREKCHEHGTIAISTAMDYAAVDLAINRPVLQDLAGGPSLFIDWDFTSFMNFGSANYRFLHKIGFNYNDVRYLSYIISRYIYERYGTRAGMSIGQTIPGEGHAPVYTDPEMLKADASAIKAAGIIHFAIYDLQGVVDKPDPDAWILAVKDAPAEKPRYSVKAVCFFNTLKTLGWVLEGYRTVKKDPLASTAK